MQIENDKQFLDFRGLQLYHLKLQAEISKVEDNIPTISMNEAEEILAISDSNKIKIIN